MRGLIIVLALIVVLSVAAHAATPLNESLCTDTDGGGAKSKDAALKVSGEVKYGITSQSDVCLTSETGVSTNSSKWLKEYFCNNDKRESQAYDCTRLGFTSCLNGECKGAASGSGSGSTSNQTQQTQPTSVCGNKVIDKNKGEECDPPNHICFGKTSDQYGLCDSNCKCKISGAAQAAHQPVCGDGARDVGEDCEADDECHSGYVCSSCKCVKELTQEDIEAMKKSATEKKDDVKTETEKAIDDKYKAPENHEVDLTVKNFSDEPGMKAASGIAGFFKGVFGWIASLFG
jgi:hypothetical protein